MSRDGRRQGTGRRGRAACPGVEGLEGRQLLYAAVGAAWPHPNLITYSIVPDGTNVGGYASNLVSSFNARWSTSTWAGVIQEAAAIWEQVANINLVPVADDGAAMGAGPDQQGDPGMGDIRISGLPSSVLGSGTLGYTLYPPPINGGSSSGDIVFNTSQPWAINNNFDLLTVAIHEFGHALGLGESTIQQAVMYGTYLNVNQGLAPDDIAGIDAIYGARQPDLFEAKTDTTTSAGAADLTPYLNSLGQFAYGALDLQSPSKVEWFKVTVPAGASGSMLVTMQATNLSLLSPAVAVYNGSVQYLGQAGVYNSPGGTVSIRINGVAPGQVYYLQAYGYSSAYYSAGNYGLEVNFRPDTNPMPAIAPPVTTTASGASAGGGGSFDTTSIPGTGPDPAWLLAIQSGSAGNSGGGAHGHGGDGGDGSNGKNPGGPPQGPNRGQTSLYRPVAPPQSTPAVVVNLGSSTPLGPLSPGLGRGHDAAD